MDGVLRSPGRGTAYCVSCFTSVSIWNGTWIANGRSDQANASFVSSGTHRLPVRPSTITSASTAPVRKASPASAPAPDAFMEGDGVLGAFWPRKKGETETAKRKIQWQRL